MQSVRMATKPYPAWVCHERIARGGRAKGTDMNGPLAATCRPTPDRPASAPDRPDATPDRPPLRQMDSGHGYPHHRPPETALWDDD